VYNLRDDPSGFLPVPFLGSASFKSVDLTSFLKKLSILSIRVDFTLSGQGSPFLLIIKLIGRFLL
jgi:hypothetical protein